MGWKKYIINLAIVLVSAFFSSVAMAAIEARLIKFWDDSEESSLINLDHTPYQEILQKYVLPNGANGIARFDYERVSEQDLAKLQNYLKYLQFMEPRQLSSAEAKAYWINLYNAATLNMVINAYFDKGISKVMGRGLPARRWRRDIVTVSQQDMSLEDILNGVIRPLYKDPRVHYALFYGALGGPDISTDVLDGDNNNELLNQFEANYLKHSRAVRVESGELILSEMFKNFDTDFAPNKSELLTYLKERVPEDVAQSMNNISSDITYEYDLTLNAP